MESIIKILDLLNKPIHFFAIGLFIFIWGIWVQYSLDYIFLGMLLIILAGCSFIDKTMKNYQLRKNEKIKQEKEQQKQERIHQNIIKKYENMPYDDRSVIDECLDNGYPVFKDNYSEHKKSIVSLCSQGWGISNDFSTVFTMKHEYLNILLNYKKEKAAKKKVSRKRNKADAE